MDMKNIFSAVAVVAGLSVASTASALTITSIDGEWQNASAGVTGVGTDEIRWGNGWRGGDPSGYDFNAAGTNLTVSEGTSFVLGTFDHLNLPVTGTFLQSVDLAVSFTIAGMSQALTSVFSFDHLETTNNPGWRTRNCENGERKNRGLNVNGCADRVTSTLNESKSETFEIDGVTYIMDILGFQYGGELMTEFWTVEEQINSAELVAIFRTVENENPPTDEPPTNEPPTDNPPQQPPLGEPPVDPPSEVPLPASGLLLLAGVVGLFAKRRSA